MCMLALIWLMYLVCTCLLFFAGSTLPYYLVVGAVLVALVIIIVTVLIIYYLAKTYKKKKNLKEVTTDSARQPLLPPSTATRHSFYDSVQSWSLTSSIVRAARRFTNSVSIRAFGHNDHGHSEGTVHKPCPCSVVPKFALVHCMCVCVCLSVSGFGDMSQVHKGLCRFWACRWSLQDRTIEIIHINCQRQRTWASVTSQGRLNFHEKRDWLACSIEYLYMFAVFHALL